MAVQKVSGVGHERTALHLFSTHRTALVSYAVGIVGNPAQAEDVVQDAWLKLERARDPDLIRDPLRYLYRIVRNLAIDGRRRTKRETIRMGGSIDIAVASAPDETPSVERTLIASQDLDAVLAAIAGLPEKQRVAIEMYRFGGCKLREIGERLGISVSFAHVLVSEGLARCDRARERRKK